MEKASVTGILDETNRISKSPDKVPKNKQTDNWNNKIIN